MLERLLKYWPIIAASALAVKPNRAFLRGFSANQFPDFGLCGRVRILATIFGALSPHPKIPFPAASLERRSSTAHAPVNRAFALWHGFDLDETRG